MFVYVILRCVQGHFDLVFICISDWGQARGMPATLSKVVRGTAYFQKEGFCTVRTCVSCISLLVSVCEISCSGNEDTGSGRYSYICEQVRDK